jgi:hypothetical protein
MHDEAQEAPFKERQIPERLPVDSIVVPANTGERVFSASLKQVAVSRAAGFIRSLLVILIAHLRRWAGNRRWP